MTPASRLLVDPSRLERLVHSTFPLHHVVYAFGYGSGVFSQELKQQNSDNTEDASTARKNGDDPTLPSPPPPLVDLILVVSNAYAFHQQNYDLNPDHYWTPPSWMMMQQQDGGMPHWCTQWQRQPPSVSFLGGTNPGLYFNVTDTLKYGIVQTEDLLEDLQDWKFLYVAGRMHKPILPLQLDNHHYSPQQEELLEAQKSVNLPAALSAALLLLSDNDSKSDISQTNTTSALEEQVYHMLAGLSYRGDFRMQIRAEDPHKIQRLVGGPAQLQRFRSLYAPVVQSLQQEAGYPLVITGQSDSQQQWTWDVSSPAARQVLWQRLPPSLARFGKHDDSIALLSRELARRVAAAARYQSLKGLVTAGPAKAWRYAQRKLVKGLLLRR